MQEALCRLEEVPSWALASAVTWETYQVNLFLESPLLQEGDWSEENLVLKACQLLLSQLKSRSWDLQQRFGLHATQGHGLDQVLFPGARTCSRKAAECFGENGAAGAMSTWGVTTSMGLLVGPGPGARNPLGSCGSAWSTSAGGPRAGPRRHRVCCRWTAAAGSAGRAWGRGHPAPGGNHWTWSGWWPSAT